MKAKSLHKFPDIKADTDIMTFGKYKGFNIGYILYDNPGYILWLSGNVNIKIDGAIMQKAFDLKVEEAARKAARIASGGLVRTGKYSYESLSEDYSWMDQPY
jgi:uncharacterized protein (DUF3820 family)